MPTPIAAASEMLLPLLSDALLLDSDFWLALLPPLSAAPPVVDLALVVMVRSVVAPVP